MRRGFKAEAERLAIRMRTEIGIATDARVDLIKLAKHLGVEVRTADELVPRSDLERLETLQSGSFSAATIRLPNGRVVAIVNPVGSTKARQDSSLAHELAHIALNHEPRTVEQLGGLTFFECDKEQEDEANWLAGCLLLPRPLLLSAARKGYKAEQVADIHSVSVEMARFRLNASGVYFQASSSARRTGG